MAKIF